jgi:hypothetical protein
MIPIVVSIRHSLPCVELAAHAVLEVVVDDEVQLRKEIVVMSRGSA